MGKWEKRPSTSLKKSATDIETFTADHFNLWDEDRNGEVDATSSPVAVMAPKRKGTMGSSVQTDGAAHIRRVGSSQLDAIPSSSISIVGTTGEGSLSGDGLEARLQKFKWPAFVRGFRPHQLEAVRQVLEALERVDVVFLDAPTGSGKTLIGEMVRVALGKRGLYVCSGIQLQSQFAGDFQYAKLLKGRGNYATADYPYPTYTAADCNKTKGKDDSCTYCPSVQMCGYETAKRKAISAEVACLNTTYWLYEANHVGRMSGRDVVVVDEADVLEEELLRFVEFRVGEKVLEGLRVDAPKKSVHKQTIKSWMRDELLVGLINQVESLEGVKDKEAVKKLRTYEGLVGGCLRVLKDLEDDPENWVRDYEWDGKKQCEKGSFVLRPIRVDRQGGEMVWGHGKKFVLMSATVISADQMARDLGIEDGRWELVTVPMTFKVENRPIVMVGGGNMTRKTEEVERPKMLRGLRSVLEMHRTDNVLVHTNSYALTKWLQGELGRRLVDGRRVVSYTNSRDRDEVVEGFKRHGGVLLAPSLERGVDLPDDLCRVVVVAKVPFPSLGDKQTSARLHTPGGQSWYQVQTIRKIVQMTGRGVRSEGDSCVTYVLDKQFGKLYREGRKFFPQWWVNGVEYGVNSEWAGKMRRMVR